MGTNNELLLRHWTMLRMIPRYPRKITARELSERISREGFSITKRSIERDLQSISTVFPLVADEREKPYGWSWAEQAPSFNLPGMSPSLALTFKLAETYLKSLMPTGMLNELSPYFKVADTFLDGANNPSSLTTWPEKISVTYSGQPLLPPKVDPKHMITIEEALLEERQVELKYLPRGEIRSKEFAIHPLGIIIRGSISYLACTMFEYQDVRLLALHRVTGANKLEISCQRPKHFVLENYAQSGALGFNENGFIELVLKFDKNAGMHLYETPLNEAQIITEDNQHLVVRATVMDNSQLRWWILGFGSQVQVIQPSPLREWFRNEAALMSDLYSKF